MSRDELKPAVLVEYSGIQILYLEDLDKWRFELRGRERKADSLKQAKEWIDKPAPEKKASKSFERFQCYHLGRSYGYHYGTSEIKPEVVTVTSVAQDTYRNSNVPSVAWITHENGEREKVDAESLLPINDVTKQLVVEYNATVKTISRLMNQNKELLSKTKRVDLSKYVDNGDE